MGIKKGSKQPSQEKSSALVPAAGQAGWLTTVSVTIPVRSYTAFMKYVASLAVNDESIYHRKKGKRSENRRTNAEHPKRNPKVSPTKNTKNVKDSLLDEARLLRAEARDTKSESLKRLCLQRADEITANYLSSDSDLSEKAYAETCFRRNEELLRERLVMRKTEADLELKVAKNVTRSRGMDVDVLEEVEYRAWNKVPAPTVVDEVSHEHTLDGVETKTVSVVVETPEEKVMRWTTPAQRVAMTDPQSKMSSNTTASQQPPELPTPKDSKPDLPAADNGWKVVAPRKQRLIPIADLERPRSPPYQAPTPEQIAKRGYVESEARQPTSSAAPWRPRQPFTQRSGIAPKSNPLVPINFRPTGSFMFR